MQTSSYQLNVIFRTRQKGNYFMQSMEGEVSRMITLKNSQYIALIDFFSHSLTQKSEATASDTKQHLK
jgi:hypothetical protein